MPQPDRWGPTKIAVYTFGSGNSIDVIYALLTFYLDQNSDVLVRLSE